MEVSMDFDSPSQFLKSRFLFNAQDVQVCYPCSLSLRNSQVQSSSFNLYLDGKRAHDVAQKIMNHVFSLNLQQVNFTCLFETDQWYNSLPDVEYPLSLSGSQTLKHLTLRQSFTPCDEIVLTSAQEFSSLTTLDLQFITLYDGFLSMCPNLKNMTLVGCKVTGSFVLTICHPRLSNLTIDEGDSMTRIVNVVTPQLKNLSIVRYSGRFRVSAPELASLLLRGPCPSRFSSDGFPCLEKALIFIHGIEDGLSSFYTSHIISLLQQLHYVKFLSLSMDIIQVLNASVEIISHQPSPLAKLESLMLLPKLHFWYNDKHKRVIVSTEVKNYLLSRSPKATLTEVLQEDCYDLAAGALIQYIESDD